MLKLKILPTIICVVFSVQLLYAQKLELKGNWKYTFKDDPGYSASAFDDTNWQEKNAGNLLFPANNESKIHYVWLRETFVIPSSYKKELSKTGALSVFLGRISQADQTYFNGELIGETNSSEAVRNYLINTQHINWDKANSIAIRISYWDVASGLQNSSPPYLASASPVKIFTLSSATQGITEKDQAKNKKATFTLLVNNASPKVVNAIATASFYDFSKKKIVAFNKTVKLTMGTNEVNYPFVAPTAFIKVKYELTIPAYNFNTGWNAEYGYTEVYYHPETPVIPDKIDPRFAPADLQQQVITGWLGERLKDNEKNRLYNVDETALLAGYINRPGSHPWIGEHVGKFLDAAANTYRNTASPLLKKQMDRMAQQLIAGQLDNGYLGTYTPDNYWTSWDVWSHKYCIIGLLNYYSLSGFKPALTASRRAGDLLCKTFGYGKGQLDIIKAGEHVGMAATSVLEPMVDLYKFTGDKKYLDFCYYIIKSYEQANGPKIISSLNSTGRVDKTANAKAYEMLSNLVGIIKLYKLTGDDHFFKPVINAWNDIVNNRLYITGTASSFEHFGDNDALPASANDNMGEGCVTTTWIQLNYQLLCITGEMKYVNELERSVYNHLTGAENPESGCVSYYTPLVGVKPYRCVITCCMSSVPRGIAMIPLFADGKINNKPAFLFYQPGTYTTNLTGNKKISFTTATNFPADGNIAIHVATVGPVKLPVQFRKPYWCSEFSISVNGKKQLVNNNDIVTIERIWKNDDKVEITFNMPLKVLDGGHSYPGYVALQRGPQVLAFDNNLNDLSPDMLFINAKNILLDPATSVLPAKWIGGEAFRLKGEANDNSKKIILVPYADASQTGGSITTWIKKQPEK